MDYSTAAIRSLLMQAFSSEELRAFCTDYFQDVFAQFTDTQTKGAQVQLLVEHAIEHNCFDELLDRVRDAYPAKYAEFANRLIIKPTGTATPAAQLTLEPVPSCRS